VSTRLRLSRNPPARTPGAGPRVPAQRAALYEFLATMPGLTLERNVKDISGRPGIGVSWSFMGSTAVLIFDPSVQGTGAAVVPTW
jgi:hypothetical protein